MRPVGLPSNSHNTFTPILPQWLHYPPRVRGVAASFRGSENETVQENELVKVLYHDGEQTRALRGVLDGETPDGLFFILIRPLGDRVRIAKAAVRSIVPLHESDREART